MLKKTILLQWEINQVIRIDTEASNTNLRRNARNFNKHQEHSVFLPHCGETSVLQQNPSDLEGIQLRDTTDLA